MKKIVTIIILFLSLTHVTYSQNLYNNDMGQQRGLFGYGLVSDDDSYGGLYAVRGLLDYNDFLLPNFPGHSTYDDQPAPLGSGVLLLIGFGSVYAIKRKKREN